MRGVGHDRPLRNNRREHRVGEVRVVLDLIQALRQPPLQVTLLPLSQQLGLRVKGELGLRQLYINRKHLDRPAVWKRA